MADLGNRLYLPELNEQSADALYDDAMRAILKMQLHITCDDLPAYDETRLVAEMELMPEWFLQRHLAYTPTCGEWDIIEPAFRCLVNNANMQPQKFVHRDYHSRNLLILDDNTPGILDFQDAVKGPITYDLVSLLRDCYIAWPEERIGAWVESYRRECVRAGITNVDAATFKRGFDLMGLQRHLKVLGIFCRLKHRDAKPNYSVDLPRFFAYAHKVSSRYNALRPLSRLLEPLMGAQRIETYY
jgi:aminoglycoside/choline kinase family phosphotransferase